MVEQVEGVLWLGNRLNFASVPLCRFSSRAYYLMKSNYFCKIIKSNLGHRQFVDAPYSNTWVRGLGVSRNQLHQQMGLGAVLKGPREFVKQAICRQELLLSSGYLCMYIYE